MRPFWLMNSSCHQLCVKVLLLLLLLSECWFVRYTNFFVEKTKHFSGNATGFHDGLRKERVVDSSDSREKNVRVNLNPPNLSSNLVGVDEALQSFQAAVAAVCARLRTALEGDERRVTLDLLLLAQSLVCFNREMYMMYKKALLVCRVSKRGFFVSPSYCLDEYANEPSPACSQPSRRRRCRPPRTSSRARPTSARASCSVHTTARRTSRTPPYLPRRRSLRTSPP